jgi:hypothetical protein
MHSPGRKNCVAFFFPRVAPLFAFLAYLTAPALQHTKSPAAMRPAAAAAALAVPAAVCAPASAAPLWPVPLNQVSVCDASWF